MVPLQQISLNPNKINSIKTRFTYRFLRALKELNNKNYVGSTSISSSSREIYKRFHRIKFASDASMAAAVGSKRAWSRAVLLKIKNRNMRRHHDHHHALPPSINGNPKKKKKKKREGESRPCGGKAAKQLQKLVIPGCEGIMEIGSLLDETAHYIKCLTTQDVKGGEEGKHVCLLLIFEFDGGNDRLP